MPNVTFFKNIVLILAIYIFLGNISSVHSATIFSDDFSGGYNQTLWSVRPNYFTPSPSSFGIGDTNLTNWAILDSNTTSLPSNTTVMFDINIGSTPSDVLFSCKTDFTNDLNFYNDNDLRVFLHSNGTASFDSYINGAGWSPGLFSWDNSYGTHSFRLNCNNGLMTLIEDNQQRSEFNMMSRDFSPSNHVYFGYKSGNSQFANYQLCDYNACDSSPTPTPTPTLPPTPTPTETPIPTPTPTPTATPSPTPSPTPTPTPTPTATPTPTPVPITKVILIPGFGGSWNADALLNCKADNYDGQWSSWLLADQVYNPIITSINNSGFAAKPFYYDWRKQIPDMIPNLTNFIDTNVVPNEKVDIVGHSQGGLVARGYIETEQFNNKADKFISVGAPHQGTLLAYPAWSAGEVPQSMLWKMAATFVLKNCPDSLSSREKMQQFFPSIQNLLPTFDYIKNKKTGETKTVGSMNAQNNWPRSEFMNPFNTTVAALSGYGANTLRFFYINDKEQQARNGNWLDGKPIKNEYSTQGDGTVLTDSSTLLNRDNQYLPLNHNGLIASTEGISAIMYFLASGKTSASTPISASYMEPKSALLVIAHPADFWVLDPDNKLQNGKDGITGYFNPKRGSYRAFFVPKSKSTRIIIAQFLENGQVLWKEYKHVGRAPKIATITFDPKNPLEDAMK